MDFFRKLFGFSNSQNNYPETGLNRNRPNDFENFLLNDERFGIGGFWNGIFQNEQDPNNGQHDRKSHMFTDPFAMHHYFHEQVNNFFKNFGLSSFENFNLPAIPSLPDGNMIEDYPPDSREHFLKSDVLKQTPNYDESEKIDRDLDGQLNKAEIDKFFEKPELDDKVAERKVPKSFGGVFSQFVQVEAVTKPDGSMEIRKVVKDSEGNEKVTITQRNGDKEYTFNY